MSKATTKELKTIYIVYGLLVGSDFYLNYAIAEVSPQMRYHICLVIEQRLGEYISQ